MKIDMLKFKYFLALFVSWAVLFWLGYYLANIQALYIFGLFGILVCYFSFRAVFWPIREAYLRGPEEFFVLKSLETLFYYLTLGLGAFAIMKLVMYLFKILMW